MLVRAGDGEWQRLEPASQLPPGGFRAMCGPDAASLLELETPLPVAAFAPLLGGAAPIDALCLSPDGDVALLVACFGEQPVDTLWRLTNAAGALRGIDAAAFDELCGELHGAPAAAWLASRFGGSADTIASQLRHVLDTGAFELVAVTAAGAEALSTPLRFLQAGPATVRVFGVELLQAGDVQAIEGSELPLDGAEAAAPAAAPVAVAAPVVQRWTPEVVVAEPVVAEEPTFDAFEHPLQVSHVGHVDVPDFGQPFEPAAAPAAAPEPEPAPIAEPEPEAVEPELPAAGPFADVAPDPVLDVAATEDEDEPVVVEAQQGEPSDEAAFLAAVDRLDHKASAHMRFLHERCTAIVSSMTFARDAEIEYMVGWIGEGADTRALLGLDSRGTFQVLLSELPEDEQAEFAEELAGLKPGAEGAVLLENGVAELSVIDHLNDETLLEYVLDNLSEALPGGRAVFAELAAPLEDPEDEAPDGAADEAPVDPASFDDVGDDFFGAEPRHGGDDEYSIQDGEAEQAEQAAPLAADDATDAVDEPAAATGDAPAAPTNVREHRDGKRGIGRMLRRRGGRAA